MEPDDPSFQWPDWSRQERPAPGDPNWSREYEQQPVDFPNVGDQVRWGEDYSPHQSGVILRFEG